MPRLWLGNALSRTGPSGYPDDTVSRSDGKPRGCRRPLRRAKPQTCIVPLRVSYGHRPLGSASYRRRLWRPLCRPPETSRPNKPRPLRWKFNGSYNRIRPPNSLPYHLFAERLLPAGHCAGPRVQPLSLHQRGCATGNRRLALRVWHTNRLSSLHGARCVQRPLMQSAIELGYGAMQSVRARASLTRVPHPRLSDPVRAPCGPERHRRVGQVEPEKADHRTTPQ